MLSLRTRQMPEMKEQKEGESKREKNVMWQHFSGASRENFSIKKIN